jgi:hypothetical protein
VGTELLEWEELAFEYLMPFLTGEHFPAFLPHLPVMSIMAPGTAESAAWPGCHEFFTAVITELAEAKLSVIAYHFQR